MIPLYGFLEGDTIGLLMLGHDTDTVASLAEQLQRSASVRVAPRTHMAVRFKGTILPPTMTLARAGMKPLDRFDVVPQERAP